MFAGIDIGGGQTKAAIFNGSEPEAVRDPRGNTSMPTEVAEDKDGKLLYGWDAKEYGLVYPKQHARDFKRHLAEQANFIDGKYDATMLFSFVFAEMKRLIEAQACDTLDAAVITCPANLKDAKRGAILKAAEIAKLKVLRLITEPAAAAYLYAYKLNYGTKNTLFGCADWGSTTFDGTLMKVEGGVATPIATEGVPELGGIDLTNQIKALILEKVSKLVGKTITEEKLTPEQRADLEYRAENAKIALGRQPSTKVPVPFGGKHQQVEVMQGEYHARILPLVKKALQCMDAAMASCNKKYSDLEILVAAGGPSLDPFIQKQYADHTGHVPKMKYDPSLVVAFGAALDAQQQGGGKNRFIPSQKPIVLQEATAHDVGVAVIEESGGVRQVVQASVVPKNTPVPGERVEHFRLERETNTECHIEILQGPNGAALKDCITIGACHLKGLPVEAQRSARIEVKFKFDSNAMVAVTVTDLVSKKSQTVSVQLGGGGVPATMKAAG